MKTVFFKKLLKSVVLVGILTSITNAKYLTYNKFQKKLSNEYSKQIKILGNYIINGFHSKNDVNNFVKTYNQIFGSIKSPIMLDKTSFLAKSYGKNDTIFATIVIKHKNLNEIKKNCEEAYSILKVKAPKNINIKKCQERIDKIILDTNLYKKCKMLYNKNFYKYGGKLEYVLKDVNYDIVFRKTVNSDNDCNKVRKDILDNFEAIKKGE